MDPTPDNLLALDPGDEVIIHLENGWDIPATVADPHHPNLGQEAEREIREEGGGNGQVTVFFDTEGGDRAITAYHEDKNPDRRRELAKFEVPSIYSHEWREVVSIERVEPDGGPPVILRCVDCGALSDVEFPPTDHGECPDCGGERKVDFRDRAPDLLECRVCDWSEEYEIRSAGALRKRVGCPDCGGGIDRTLGIYRDDREGVRC